MVFRNAMGLRRLVTFLCLTGVALSDEPGQQVRRGEASDRLIMSLQVNGHLVTLEEIFPVRLPGTDGKQESRK